MICTQEPHQNEAYYMETKHHCNKFLGLLSRMVIYRTYVPNIVLNLQETKSTQTLQNELVFYNPQEPLDEELSALMISK